MMKVIFGLIILLMNNFVCSNQQAANQQAYSSKNSFIMPPYLQAVTSNSIYVLVESTSNDTIVADYGLTSVYGSSAKTSSIATTTSPTYVHRIHLTNLKPNTIYHYRVHVRSDSSQDATFKTALITGEKFRFAWMADCRSGTDIYDQIIPQLKKTNPLFSLYGGDLCYNSSYSFYKSQFFLPNQLALAAQVPFFNAVGNHEGWSRNTKAFTYAPASTSGTQEYYSFDYGCLHVLVLNTEIDYSTGSPQYQFALTDLSSSTKQWKIVIAHKPAYCSGGHNEDSDLKIMTTNIFEPQKVDAFFAGHSHFYQHNLVNGIHHLVMGSAGAPLTTPSNASYTIKSVKQYNYAICDVDSVSLKMTVYDPKGNVLDTLLLKKIASIEHGKIEQNNDLELFQNSLYTFPQITNVNYRFFISDTSKGFLCLKQFDKLSHFTHLHMKYLSY